MNEERILAAIAELKETVSGRMDGFEERLSKVEATSHVTVDLAEKLFTHQRKQAEDIDELFRRLEEMRESPSAVWRSRDGREVGLDREDTYEMFRELGYGRREALKLIDLAGRLSRDDSKHYSKPVRVGDEIRRAIVILEKE